MINLPNTFLRRRPAVTRGLVAAVALAASAALAMPGAEAVTAGATAVQPTPVQGETAKTEAAITPAAAANTLTAGWTSSSAWNRVRHNRLYSTPYVAASHCKERHVALNTLASVRSYDAVLLNCLKKVWVPIIWRAGGRWRVNPNLVVYGTRSIRTACGTVTNTTSLYCGYRNGTIYIPWYVIANQYKHNTAFARAYATNTLAHEYGHHIQSVTGILDASWYRQNRMSTQAQKLQENRRRELQASCFGSVSIGSNRNYYPMRGAILTQWNYLVAHSGDIPGHPRDHGTWTNHNFWSHAGFRGQHAASCQVWAAPPSRVA